MKHIREIAIASVACMMLIGCGDSYSDSKADNKAELKVLKRNASFLTDVQGMSLYTFDKDALNKSNCDAECQKIWPLFTGVGTADTDLTTPENDQLAYRKHPLYTFLKMRRKVMYLETMSKMYGISYMRKQHRQIHKWHFLRPSSNRHF